MAVPDEMIDEPEVHVENAGGFGKLVGGEHEDIVGNGEEQSKVDMLIKEGKSEQVRDFC